MNTTHDDLHRDIGRMEGNLNAVRERMDRLEKTMNDGFSDITRQIAAIRDDINKRVVPLETAEHQRRGGLAVIVALASLLSGGLGALLFKLTGG